ncbi:hypothetical protein DM02DRAFT_556275 [Periconia macrospinosa]|uniref:LCCL domain-containing protein n=1 Tax=Periconia macrospinosa TaxID=97972 RepID=A0A2V1E4Z5_9PLEO|nr:hypothetical protein DM02DRAFT_556275 [Periconia macrospinosa]
MSNHEQYTDLGVGRELPVDAEDEEARLLAGEEMELQDSASPRRIKKNRRVGILEKLKGPHQPEIQTIRPFFPHLQELAPRIWTSKISSKKHQLMALAFALLFWFCIFFGLLSAELPIKDENQKYVVGLDCTDTFFRRKNECGLDGIDCRPFQNVSFAFRCPANCASVKVLNPRAVGPVEVIYRPLVIGNGTYRGDSFICGSAIHAGVISNGQGGCGRVTLVGKHQGYSSAKRNGIESIAFDSYFPLSFALSADAQLHCSSDPRKGLIILTLVVTTAISLCATTPRIFFVIFVLIFALVSFGTDPPSASYRNFSVLPDHISMFAKRLLPAMFCAVVLYLTVVKRTLSGITAQIEKTIFWLGGIFIGALGNYTFDWIPIQRLTAHDLQQQPGALVALVTIVAVLAIIIIGQMRSLWLEGRLPRYLMLYGLFLLGILLFILIPGVSLRLHHYIIALLLLPGTSLQTRPSLLYQGILLGLFVNGVARWDFDSILQTADALRGDAKLDSIIPEVPTPQIKEVANEIVAAFSWTNLPVGMDGISLLINEVERSRKFRNDNDGIDTIEFSRPSSAKYNEYVRFAFMREGRALDYSDVGILYGNGTWVMNRRAL